MDEAQAAALAALVADHAKLMTDRDHEAEMQPKVVAVSLGNDPTDPAEILAKLRADNARLRRMNQHNLQSDAPSFKAPAGKVAQPKPIRKDDPKEIGQAPQQKAGQHAPPFVHTTQVPSLGTLDAQAFMTAYRQAGRRTRDNGEGKPIPFYDANLAREDRIRAISGFVGYSGKLSYGMQESYALSQARMALRGTTGPSRQESRQAMRGNPTYVCGKPDHRAKLRADLEGREREAAERMAQFERDANNLQLQSAERTLAAGLAQVEAARINEIRDHLDRLDQG